MNKDNLLFAVIGILFGFITGYLLHEVMAARQPPRRVAGLSTGTPAATAGAPGDSAGALDPADPMSAGGPAGLPPPAENGAAAAAAGPVMKEILALRDRVAQHPEDAEAVLRLANANYDIKSWQRARDLYLQYLKMRPNSPETLTDLGITYRYLNDFDHALASFHQAQQLQPENWQSRFDEVIVLAVDLNRIDEARSVLAQLKKLKPKDDDVERLAAEVERRATAPSSAAAAPS